MRLSDIKAEAEAENSQRQERRDPVTPEGFARAWALAQQQFADKHMLAAAMAAADPVQSSPEVFAVTVDHPAAKQAFDTTMTPLLAFLREQTGNDFLTLDVKVSDAQIVKRLPPQELLGKIAADNPLIAEMLATLEGELD